MAWAMQVQYATTLSADDLARIRAVLSADERITVAYDSHQQLLRITGRSEDHDVPPAGQLQRWVACVTHPAVTGVDPDATLVAAQADKLGITTMIWALGAARAAARLGMSKERLYQLAGGPDFPDPVPGVAGVKLWRADDLDTWKRERVVQKGGRPRKNPPADHG